MNVTNFKLKNKALVQTNNTIAFRDGFAMQTDLSNWILSKNKLLVSDGVYNKDAVKVDTFRIEYPISQYPILPELGEKIQEFNINSDILHKFAKFCGVDDLRPIFKHVFINNGEITATDAHKMIFEKIDIDKDVYILISKDIIKHLPKKESLKVTVYEKHYTIECNDYKHISNIYEYRYVDYKAVIPTSEPEYELTFNPKLINWAKLKESAVKKNEVCIITHEGIKTKDIDSNKEHLEPFTGSYSTKGEFKIHTNLLNLMTCIEGLDTVHLKINKKIPIRINDNIILVQYFGY